MAVHTGEGGFVVSTDPSFGRAVCMRANFGFAGSRQAQAAAFNAKLSEYHAAVGLAGLDEWDTIRAEWSNAADAYRRALGRSNQISLQHGFGEAWVGSTCLLSFVEPAADRIEQSLTDCGIETRRWWGSGAHDHPSTASLPRTAVPATDTLARSTLGVPFYRDIGAAEIARVAEVVLGAVDAAP